MLRTRPAAAAAATPPRCRFASSRLAMAAMRRRSCRPRLFSDDASGPAARRSPTKAVGGACDKDSVQHFTLDEYDYPTPDTIHACPPPRRFSEYSSETLGVMAGQGVHGAFKERLLREIMRVDGCPYAESYAVLGEMNRKNEELMWLFQLPYRISIGATALIGLFAVPAVFHRDTALWFCTHFVKNETPPVETLDTMWKVGSWTWEWRARHRDRVLLPAGAAAHPLADGQDRSQAVLRPGQLLARGPAHQRLPPCDPEP